MKPLNLKRLSLACSATLASAMLASGAVAVNLATDGIGEVAIAPYYTVRDGWQTTMNVINTQDRPIVVKVRVHEGQNSRDVLDFNVALSAFDVFTGVIRESVNGTGPVFVAVDQANQDGRRTCTIPNSVASGSEIPLSALAFGPAGSAEDDGGPTSPGTGEPQGNTQQAQDRMREGYVEYIVLGYADVTEPPEDASNTDLLQNHIGYLIEEQECSLVQQAFNSTNIVTTAQQFGEPINALKFNFVLFNPNRGVEAGNTATTWANFFNPAGGPNTSNPGEHPLPQITPSANAACTITRGHERRRAAGNGARTFDWVPDGLDGSCQNLITAQIPFDFLEPSLNDAYPQVAHWWDDARNFAAYGQPTAQTNVAAPENIRGVDALSLTIQRSDIVNEWSNNSDRGVTTDWIVTMPTKHFYVDGDSRPLNQRGHQAALIESDREEAILAPGGAAGIANLAYAPFANRFGRPEDEIEGEEDRLRATACNQVRLAVFDRAEQRTHQEDAEEVIVSPAPPPVVETVNLCFETNVVTWNHQSALNSFYPVLDENGNPTTVDTSTLPEPFNNSGWMRMDLTAEDQGGLAAVQVGGEFSKDSGLARGLPVTGFMLKHRNFGQVSRNFASSTDHAYMRIFGLSSP